MTKLELLTEIERYLSSRGLTESDAIESLIEALEEEVKEEQAEIGEERK